MKLSGRQKKIQEQINKLLLAGIPLATLISVNAEGAEINSAHIRGKRAVEKQDVQIYVVQPRDTMYKIAKKYHTTAKEICRINGIKEENAGKLIIGQKLQLPTKNAEQEKKIQMPVGTVAAPENSKNEKKSQKIIIGERIQKK